MSWNRSVSPVQKSKSKCVMLNIFLLFRLDEWEVQWSSLQSQGSFPSRTDWRMIAEVWAMMRLTMAWAIQCTTALCPVTTMAFPKGHHVGLGELLHVMWIFTLVNSLVLICCVCVCVCVCSSLCYGSSSSGVTRAPWMVI